MFIKYNNVFFFDLSLKMSNISTTICIYKKKSCLLMHVNIEYFTVLIMRKLVKS